MIDRTMARLVSRNIDPASKSKASPTKYPPIKKEAPAMVKAPWAICIMCLGCIIVFFALAVERVFELINFMSCRAQSRHKIDSE